MNSGENIVNNIIIALYGDSSYNCHGDHFIRYIYRC